MQFCGLNRKELIHKLARTDKNKEFSTIDRAVEWLHNNRYETQILKWETKAWGEIPADFGRK